MPRTCESSSTDSTADVVASITRNTCVETDNVFSVRVRTECNASDKREHVVGSASYCFRYRKLRTKDLCDCAADLQAEDDADGVDCRQS
jgi:hypothetical protein